jgi:hypothetical protein
MLLLMLLQPNFANCCSINHTQNNQATKTSPRSPSSPRKSHKLKNPPLLIPKKPSCFWEQQPKEEDWKTGTSSFN